MLGLPLRYFLKHPGTMAACVAEDPLQLRMTVRDGYAAARERKSPDCQYESDLYVLVDLVGTTSSIT